MIISPLVSRINPTVRRKLCQSAGFASRKSPRRGVPASHLLGLQSGKHSQRVGKVQDVGKSKGVVRWQSSGQQDQSRHPTNHAQPATEPASAASSLDKLLNALRDTKSEDNNLLAPVHIPEDPDSILKENHPATKILANSAIIVHRQLEMMTLMIGLEQANKYTIVDPQGNHLGYMAEQEIGLGKMMARQWFKRHRSFTTHVFDTHMKEVLRFHRPFSWITSAIRVYDPIGVTKSSFSKYTALIQTAPGSFTAGINEAAAQTSNLSLSEMRVIGGAQQKWAPLRRKYNMFLHRSSDRQNFSSAPQQLLQGELPGPGSQKPKTSPSTSHARHSQNAQFAYVDEPFHSWDFSLMSSDGKIIGSVNRNFTNIGRELLTDTGVYALRMDSAGISKESGHILSKSGQSNPSAYSDSRAGMSLDQRAVMLATAVSVDFDYFTRSRISPASLMPAWVMGGRGVVGAGASGTAAGGIAAGGAGAGIVGSVARGAGADRVANRATGAAVGMGIIAGYEAMQRGAYGDDTYLTSDPQGTGQSASTQASTEQDPPGEEIWGEVVNPWGKDSKGSSGGGESNDGGSGGGGGGGDGGGDGGGGSDIGDWF